MYSLCACVSGVYVCVLLLPIYWYVIGFEDYHQCMCVCVWVYVFLTGSTVITHDVTTGTGYCLVGFNWIIDFLN